MSNYSALIDPCDFGTIADYLRSPSSPIEFVLHVKSKDMLGPLAEALSPEHHASLPSGQNSNPVECGLRNGSLRISSRHPPKSSDPEKFVDVATIPRHALCHVIYSPPFYLVHTPGLFEGELIKPSTHQFIRHELLSKRTPRIKI